MIYKKSMRDEYYVAEEHPQRPETESEELTEADLARQRRYPKPVPVSAEEARQRAIERDSNNWRQKHGKSRRF